MTDIQLIDGKVLPFKDFARLRHAIWLHKLDAERYPLPEDALPLTKHHYTNIWRELDRNSVYLFNSVQKYGLVQRDMLRYVEDTIRFRLFNKIDTNEAMLWEFSSLEDAYKDGETLFKFLDARNKRGDKNFTAAYVRCPDLRTLCVETQNDKLRPIAEQVLVALETRDSKKLINELKSIFSIGAFLADQLAMDLAWIGGPYREPAELFVPKLGPGARNGRDYAAETGQGDLDRLQQETLAQFTVGTTPKYTKVLDDGSTLLASVTFGARELEHTLCEYAKHVRVATAETPTQASMRVYRGTEHKVKVDRLPWTWSMD